MQSEVTYPEIPERWLRLEDSDSHVAALSSSVASLAEAEYWLRKAGLYSEGTQVRQVRARAVAAVDAALRSALQE